MKAEEIAESIIAQLGSDYCKQGNTSHPGEECSKRITEEIRQAVDATVEASAQAAAKEMREKCAEAAHKEACSPNCDRCSVVKKAIKSVAVPTSSLEREVLRARLEEHCAVCPCCLNWKEGWGDPEDCKRRQEIDAQLTALEKGKEGK